MKTDPNEDAGEPSAADARAAPLACDQTGAYGIVLGPGGKLLLVEDRGRFYLPGGRLEEGEGPEQALVREIREECGCAAVAGAALGEGVQPIFDGRVLLLATYWRAELGERVHDCPEHRTLWTSRAEARRLLHRRADREVVERIGRRAR